MSQAPRRSARPWSGPLLLLVTLVVLFGGLEVGFRSWEALRPLPPDDEVWAIHDEELGYRNRPDWADHNAHGLRGAPLEAPKQRFRLLLAGDSVIYYGDDSDHTLPGELSAALAADPDVAPVEVLNAGTRGYTNFQETRWIERHGLGLDPDAIGIVLVMNDLHRFLHRFDVVDGEIVGAKYRFSEEAVEAVPSLGYRVARRSHFLVWLRRRLAAFDDLVDLYTSDGFRFDYRPDFAPAWRDEPWMAVEAQLDRIAELARVREIPVFVVAMPFGDQLDPRIVSRDPAYVMRPQRRLVEICHRLKLPLLDLLPLLELEPDLEADGVHLSARGRHRSAAELAAFLTENALVPAMPASTVDR